jgi:hypothetical protein
MSEWVDITALCRGAALQLTDTNPMLAVPDVSLFDYMNATEVSE